MPTLPNSAFRHIFVVSGPSGVGKASIVNALLQTTSLQRIVTCATRPKRPNETDGVDYHFVSLADFDRLVAEGDIVENVRVYIDHYYGSPLLRYDPCAPDRLMELDQQGRSWSANAYHPHLTTIFLLPPSIDTLRQRIEARHQEANLSSRLAAGLAQMGHASEYDYIVQNDVLSDACDRVTAVVRAMQQHLLRGTLLQFADHLRRQGQTKDPSC